MSVTSALWWQGATLCHNWHVMYKVPMRARDTWGAYKTEHCDSNVTLSSVYLIVHRQIQPPSDSINLHLWHTLNTAANITRMITCPSSPLPALDGVCLTIWYSTYSNTNHVSSLHIHCTVIAQSLQYSIHFGYKLHLFICMLYANIYLRGVVHMGIW